MPIVELRGDVYEGLYRLRHAMERYGETGDALVVRTDVFTCLFSRQEHHLEMAPLNPILHANFLASIAGQSMFRMPRAVYQEQQAEAAQLYEALQKMYAKHTNWLPKTTHYCLYREDDLETISNAFQIMRAYLTSSADQRCLQTIRSSGNLFTAAASDMPGVSAGVARPVSLSHREHISKTHGKLPVCVSTSIHGTVSRRIYGDHARQPSSTFGYHCWHHHTQSRR